MSQRGDLGTSLTKFGSNPRRYLNHQQGIAGTVMIRVVEARGLDVGPSSFWGKQTCNAYACFSIGNHEVRSSTATSNTNPTWRKELLELPLSKIDLLHTIRDSPALVDLHIELFTEGSLVQKAGISHGHRIGEAYLDVTNLVDGNVEIMDQWIVLRENATYSMLGSKKNAKVNGEVHIMLQYEPRGLEPITGDIVKLEGFGSYPSCIFPPIANLSLLVRKVNGNYLFCSDINDEEVTFRLHRYCVFVVERRTFLDIILDRVKTPVLFVMNTKVGAAVCDATRPYVTIAMALSAPVVSAAKATIIAAFRASTAVLGSIAED